MKPLSVFLKLPTMIAILAVLYSGLVHAEPEKTFKIGLVFESEEIKDSAYPRLREGMEIAKQMFLEKRPAPHAPATAFNIELLPFLHKENLKDAAKAAQEAAKAGVNAVIGAEDSHYAMIVGEELQKKKVVLITPTATSPQVLKNRPLVFTASTTDDLVADKLADFTVKKLRAKNIGVLHGVSVPYTDYLANHFVQRLQHHKDHYKTPLKWDHEKFVRGENDFVDAIRKFKKDQITHVAIFVYQQDLLKFVEQARALDFHPTLIGADGWGTPTMVQQALFKNSKSEDITAYQATYWNTGSEHPLAAKFKQAYKKKYKKDADTQNAIGFDSLWVLLHAATTTPDPAQARGKSLAQALERIEVPAVTAKNFSFNKNHAAMKALAIYRIDRQDSKFDTNY